MVRKIAYWSSTGIAALMLLFSLSYLTGTEQVVSGFAKAGYPQHLRIVLGIAKPAAAVVLLLPGLALLKEWAYAGAAFAWVMAFIAHYSGGTVCKCGACRWCSWHSWRSPTRPGLRAARWARAHSCLTTTAS